MIISSARPYIRFGPRDDPRQVKCSIPKLASQLGLNQDTALVLAAKMPVMLALEPKLLILGVNGEESVWFHLRR